MGDAYVWRRMLVSFKSASKDFCDAVAGVARHLASQQIDPAGLMPLLNNRLIPLDKNPGVRPVGIGEVLRRIIGKSLMTVLKRDITQAAGVSQVCAGHPSGCEAAYTPCVGFLLLWAQMPSCWLMRTMPSTV